MHDLPGDQRIGWIQNDVVRRGNTVHDLDLRPEIAPNGQRHQAHFARGIELRRPKSLGAEEQGV